MNINDFTKGDAKVSVVGLGYVGLPLALAFARKVSVIGFDVNVQRIAMLKEGKDPSDELVSEDFANTDIVYTHKVEDLGKACFHIVAVPTPIDEARQPDLVPLISATKSVGSILKKGDCVVYESTVYPGATEEECIPLLEKLSGLKCGKDFKVGYSPERINPGDKEHTLAKTKKIISGCDTEALRLIRQMYGLVVEAGLHEAPSIKVAEAAKIIENTQRDVNIALMNELSIIFNRMGINTYDVLEAAGTKWNFHPYKPGLVGGHCIGVDPYYLVYKSRTLHYHPKVINTGRFVNDSMGAYIAKKTVKRLITLGKSIQKARVLVLGLTFKENVSDIRNTKVVDIIRELNDYGLQVDVTDPKAEAAAVAEMYRLELKPEPETHAYDAVVAAVAHREYIHWKEEDFAHLLKDEKCLVVDVKGIYRNRISRLPYWSL